jgi:hypothetical protein
MATKKRPPIFRFRVFNQNLFRPFLPCFASLLLIQPAQSSLIRAFRINTCEFPRLSS